MPSFLLQNQNPPPATSSSDDDDDVIAVPDIVLVEQEIDDDALYYNPGRDTPALEKCNPAVFELECPMLTLLFNEYLHTVSRRIEQVSSDLVEFKSAMIGDGVHSLNFTMSGQEALDCVRYHLNFFQERKVQYQLMDVDGKRAARRFNNCLERLRAGWDSERLDRAVMNYLLKMRYLRTAKEFAERRSLQDLFHIEPFYEAQRIAEAIRSKNLNPAKNWCRENAPGSILAVHLEFQEFIELLREDRKMDAISFARKFVKGLFWNVYKKHVLRMFGAVAFGCNVQIPKYKILFHEGRWDFLVKLFNQEFDKFHKFTQNASSLCILLEAGITALSIPTSYWNTDVNIYPLLPNRFPEFQMNPWSRLLRPRLHCRVTGKLMSEKNPPFMLPNGYAYSKEAISKMQNGENIICPRTNDVFRMSDVRELKLEGPFGYSMKLKKRHFFTRRNIFRAFNLRNTG